MSANSAAAGDILTDARNGALGMTFQYDVEGRLSKAWQTAAPANGGVYGYDALNRLASRTVTSPSSATTLYVHDINNHIIAETNTAGQTLREYIWLNDLPVAVVDNVNTASPAVYYVHSDHLGRPARMTAQNQSWAWDVIYDPFGNVSYSWSNPEVMNIRFPGQWFQLETGLAYNWHRHYDATLGRYVQPDPIGLAGGKSLYGYVGGSPLVWADPLGLCPSYAPDCIEPVYPDYWAIGALLGPSFTRTFFQFGANAFQNDPTGLPPPGIAPPVKNPDLCVAGPASRRGSGGQSLYDESGGEWRYFEGDNYHSPHWDYNPWNNWNSQWQNVSINGLPPRKLP